jgi:phage tail-like protein
MTDHPPSIAIFVLRGDQRQQVSPAPVPLSKRRTTIGTRGTDDICLPALAWSGEVAVLERDEHGKVTLIPRGTRCPVHVGGDALPGEVPYPLADGYEISIGIYRLVFRVLPTSAAATALTDTQPPSETEQPKAAPPPLRLEEQPSRFQPVETPTSRYLADLPLVYYTGDQFLGRYLKIFEEIWEPLEQRQDHIALYFDPCTCPVAFLSMMEGWFGVTFSSDWPESCRRALLAKAEQLFAERGTAKALKDSIEIYTGVEPAISVDDTALVVTIDPRLPPGNRRAIGHEQIVLERSAVVEIIRALKPAHVAYHLIWRDES